MLMLSSNLFVTSLTDRRPHNRLLFKLQLCCKIELIQSCLTSTHIRILGQFSYPTTQS